MNGDLERVRQILANLVDNAYHYTPGKRQIIVHLQPLDGAVQIDVEDNGIGIDSVDADRIFERFFRGKIRSYWLRPARALASRLSSSWSQCTKVASG